MSLEITEPSPSVAGKAPGGAADRTGSDRLRDVVRPGASIRGLLGFAVAAVAVGAGYAAFTDHIWEDFFITFRHSRNLCEGHGLVFTPGERVHGFTSPLGTLLPALCYLVAGGGSYVPALWLFRAIGLAAYAGAGALLIDALRRDGAGPRGEGALLGLLYVLEVKILDFSINGMETGFMALFVAWGFHLLATGAGDRRWPSRGLCWAGLMWTRPDGFVYIAALEAAGLAFRPEPGPVRWPSHLRSGGICALVYAPWFGWAWWYYGSPVPHTVVAKSHVAWTAWETLRDVLTNFAPRYEGILRRIFLPICFDLGPGGWHPGVERISTAMASFCALYWLLPVRERPGRMASLSFALLCVYFAAIPLAYEWYLPPASMIGLVVLARGIPTLAAEIAHRRPRAPAVARLVLGALVLERACYFGQTAFQMKAQQLEVEMWTRAQVGRWLHRQVRSGETVYLEPLGYIGYFSQARMLDWPGLVTPEIVRLRREKRLNFISILPELRPDWLVLREYEVKLMSRMPFFLANYRAVETFDARPRLAKYFYIPGRGYLLCDSEYTVYRKIRPPASK